MSKNSRDKWMVFLAAFLGWMFDGLEMGIFPLAARPALQSLLNIEGDAEVGKWMGIITACFLLGAAGGGLLFGWLGDRIGRVKSMVMSILAYSIFTGCCYFASAPWQLGLFRFLAALGMGGEWSLGVALVMECWPEKHRPLLAGAIGAASNVGFGLVGALGLWFNITKDSWRWVMLAGAAPALLALFIIQYVPESERWKASVKKESTSPFIEIFSGKLLKSTLLAITFASIALIGTWGSVQWLPLWADKMTKGADPQAKAITQILSASGAIVGCFIGPWIGGIMGRRIAYFLLCLTSLASCGFLFRTVSEYSAAFLIWVCSWGCHRSFLWMASALPARVVSYKSARDGAGTQLQFWPDPRSRRRLADGQFNAVLSGKLCQCRRHHYPDLCAGVVFNLACP